MYNYDRWSNVAPWLSLEFTTVKVEDGVTSIGACAFIRCPSLTSMDIPDTVTANLPHFSTYVLANVAPVSGGNSNVPQTGDHSALALYVCVLVMAMAGMTILVVNKRKA